MVTTVSRLGVAECRQIPVDGGYVVGPDGRNRGASAGPRPRPGCV